MVEHVAKALFMHEVQTARDLIATRIFPVETIIAMFKARISGK
jgi:hypothetical protein